MKVKDMKGRCDWCSPARSFHWWRYSFIEYINFWNHFFSNNNYKKIENKIHIRRRKQRLSRSLSRFETQDIKTQLLFNHYILSIFHSALFEKRILLKIKNWRDWEIKEAYIISNPVIIFLSHFINPRMKKAKKNNQEKDVITIILWKEKKICEESLMPMNSFPITFL